MVEWFKKQNVIIKSIIGIIGAFILVCLLIIAVIYLPFYSPISNGEWATVISTFFAGTLGGLIALGGIWWQLNHEKEEKKKRVKEYLIYIIDKSLNSEYLINSLIYSETLISYTRNLLGNLDKTEEQKLLTEFDENYFNGNIDIILSLKNGKEVIELNNNIKMLNKCYNRTFYNTLKKNEIMKETNELQNVIQLINKYSTVLDTFEYQTIDFIKLSLELFLQNLKLNREDHVKYPELESLISYIENLLKILKKSDGLEDLKRLEMVTDFNIKVITYLINTVSILKNTEFNKKVLGCLLNDKNANQRAIKVFKELKKISHDLK